MDKESDLISAALFSGSFSALFWIADVKRRGNDERISKKEGKDRREKEAKSFGV